LAPAVAASRRVAVRRTAPVNDSSIAARRRPSAVFHGKELVGAGAHRLEDQVGSAAAAIAKIASLAARRAAARSRPCPTRRRRGCRRRRDRRRPSACAFDDADGHAAGAEQSRDLPFEFFVVADDRCCKLGHRSS
jgi:hypothetical protein